MPEAYGQALLTCDSVANDPAGKITLYGIFDRIAAAAFPTVHPLFSIYWRCLVPGPGRVGVCIARPDGAQMVDLEPVEAGQEKGAVLQGTYTLGGLEFPAEGEYVIRLRFNAEDVLRASLHLVKRPAP